MGRSESAASACSAVRRQKGTEMAWISVDDELPEQGEPVLVYRPLAYTTDDPEVAISFYRAGCVPGG